jgi:tetratricopeptide (TPR) repeat protein
MWVETLGRLAQDPRTANVTTKVAEFRDLLRPGLFQDQQQASANAVMRTSDRRPTLYDPLWEGSVARPDDHLTGWAFYEWYRAGVPAGPILSRARARLRTQPDDLHLHALLARGEYDSDNWTGASAHYRNLVAYDGHNVAWLEGLAQSNRRLGHHRQELELYNHLLELDPDNPMAMGYSAVALSRLDQPDAAMSALDELETMHPDHPYLGVFRGLQAAIDGREAEAIAAIEESLARRGEMTDVQRLELRRDLALEPELQNLRADPRMHRMLARQLGVMAPHKRH